MKRKVIAAFLLATTAIGLAVGITYLSFYGLLDKVDQLSKPNNKLNVLSHLFEEITRLDQQQRADAIRNPKKPYKEYLNETKTLLLSIDSLSAMKWENGKQTERLAEMKDILKQRDYLLIDYLKIKSNFLLDRKFSVRLDSLATILVESKPLMDTSITTTQKKTTTTKYQPAEEKKTFFGRLFGGKKRNVVDTSQNQVEVKEEISVKVDTFAVAKQDSAIREVGKIMKTLDEDQRAQNKQIIQRELDLIGANMVLINQLLSILKEVENEEVAAIQLKNEEAASLVATSIKRIAVILIVFFLLAALLVFLILLDISRSNYYRLKLIEAKELAEQLSSVKQRFLANMSHEIRTPLQSIIGFSDQLKNPRVQAEAIEAIQSSSEHLLHIVNEMLDYTKIESDTFVIHKNPFDLEAVIDEVASVMKVQAERKGLEFILVKNNLPSSKLFGDPFRLRQIFYNLLGNAVKFTKTGFVKFEVEAKQDLLTKCRFIVSDSGMGIAPQDIKRIFGQFEQGSMNSIDHGGSGLGLTIVKKLIDLHQGNIQVSSKLGAGSAFTVTISFEKARAIKEQTATQLPAKRFLSPKDVVLVVDDDPLILRFCTLILEKNKIQHHALQQPRNVFDLDLKKIKLAFLDIRMPEVSGTELCEQLKKKEKNLKIIALTAHVLPHEKNNILKSGFDDILIKPFRESDFLRALGLQPDGENTVFDLSAVRKMTMGDELLLGSIIDQFIEETERNLSELTRFVALNDHKAAREIIHKLAGRTGQMGATDIAQVLSDLEKNLDEQKSLDELLIQKINVASQRVTHLLKELQMASTITT